MARASPRWSGASTQVRPAQAGPREPARAAPSLRHWSVTGAGRRARETSALRAGAGGAAACQGGTAAGSKPRASASARKPCCGWSAAPAASAPRRSQTKGGSAASKPGSTSAPCGSRATAAMKARVAPREPVEPATMIGCCGGCDGPGPGQRLGGGAHPTLPVHRAGGGEIAGDELEEAQAALPVGGVLGGIDAGEGGGGHALALHLVEQLGEAVGEVEGARCRRRCPARRRRGRRRGGRARACAAAPAPPAADRRPAGRRRAR